MGDMYHAAGSLVGVYADILIQGVNGIILAPVFCILELGPSTLDIKLAGSQKPPVARSVLIQYGFRRIGLVNRHIQQSRISMAGGALLSGRSVVLALGAYFLELL